MCKTFAKEFNRSAALFFLFAAITQTKLYHGSIRNEEDAEFLVLSFEF